jgi:hypothetical protein
MWNIYLKSNQIMYRSQAKGVIELFANKGDLWSHQKRFIDLHSCTFSLETTYL